jgi:ATP/ADP translocase
VEEAKEVYPKLGLLANVGLIAAGVFTRWVSMTLARNNDVLALQVRVALDGLQVVVVSYFLLCLFSFSSFAMT